MWPLLAVPGLVAGIATRCMVWYLAVQDPPRRVCPHCRLAPRRAFVPVEPLTGRCPRCGASVLPPALVPELLGAGGFALAGWIGGGPLRVAAMCWLVAFALPAVLIDAAIQRLPDVLTWPCLAGVLAFSLGQGAAGRSAPAVVRTLLATVVMAGFFLLLAVLADVGLGDVKLAPSLGAALGFVSWHAVLVGGVAASCIAGLQAAVVLIVRRRPAQARIPLAPALVAGAFLALLASAR